MYNSSQIGPVRKPMSIKPLTRYMRRYATPDLIAGLTVAMVAIPQSMAYAAIAGVSPLYGLYTVIVALIIGALFGSSHYLSTGPSNATAMAAAGILVVFAGSPQYREMIFALAIVSGLIKLLLGLFKLGGVVRFISNSVLTGFLMGAGALIIINQLSSLTGTFRPVGANATRVLLVFFQNLPETNFYVLATGLFSLILLYTLDRINQKIPSALISILSGALLIAFLGWHERGVQLVSDLESTRLAALIFHIPDINWENLNLLLTGGFAVALLSLVEAISVAKAIAASTGKHIDTSRELIGQGMASIASGFFRGIPSSGSPSRSAVNLYSGAKTRYASVFSGLVVLGMVYAFRDWIGYIPIPSLAGVVILSALRIVNWRHVILTWNSRSVSRVVMMVTFVATLLLPLQFAIYMGALLSILIYLFESSHLKITYLHQDGEGHFIERDFDETVKAHPQVCVINIDGPLYFGAVDILAYQIEKVLDTDVKVLVLRLRHMQLLASTGISVLEEEILRARHKGIKVLICGISGEVETIFLNSGIENLVGRENMFFANQVLLDSTTRALKQAEVLLNGTVVSPLPVPDQS
jgi:sulfate permease, SulP family